MDYTDAHGARRTARGVVGALALLPLGEKVIPHEETMGKHRRDRTAILDATKANLDPIIGLSAAPELPALLTTPEVGPRLSFVEDDGSHHRLYDISEPAAVAAISESVASHPVSIADGHHRYTTALAYRDQMTESHGPGPWQSIMAMVAPAEGSGLTIGPYHRVLRPLRIDEAVLDARFEVTPVAPQAPTLPGTLVLVAGDRGLLLEPRPEALAALPAPWRSSGAAVARELLYPLVGADEEGAEYTADAEMAVARAREGRIGILVSPIPEAAVAEAGDMGLRFPTKSTYFTPKPRAGLVVRCFRAAP